MRVFQFHSFYQSYLDVFNARYPEAACFSHAQRLGLLLAHRFHAAHILLPAYSHDSQFRFTVANDMLLQESWAREMSFPERSPWKVLLAQIEEHRAEIVYSLNAIKFDSSFVRRLPGCVRKTICWLAAPVGRLDLSAYDLRVCNFPPYIEEWRGRGWKCAWFSPAHDPAMDTFARWADRPIDVSFIGQYSPWHSTRNSLLERVAELGKKYALSFRLMCPQRKPLANRRYLNRIPTPIPYLPRALRAVAGPAVFGLDMYEILGQSKVVLNAAVDMSGKYRVNMRCFEAMGCGACMVSDDGIYLDGMTPGLHFRTYDSAAGAVAEIERLLADPSAAEAIAQAGHAFVKTAFSKENQWQTFQRLVAEC